MSTETEGEVVKDEEELRVAVEDSALANVDTKVEENANVGGDDAPAEGNGTPAEGNGTPADVAGDDAPAPVSSNGIRRVDKEHPILPGETGYKLVGGKVYAVTDTNNENEIIVGALQVSTTGEDLTTAVLRILKQAGGRRRSRRNSRNKDRQSKKRQQKRQSKKRQNGGRRRHGRNSKRNHKK